MCQRLGTPNTPANPFHAGGDFRGFHGSLICYGLPGCLAPCTDLTGFPAIGAFYFQASNEIGPLLDITTASTGLLCWRDFHPQEWQLDSLHSTLSPFRSPREPRPVTVLLSPYSTTCCDLANRPQADFVVLLIVSVALAED